MSDIGDDFRAMRDHKRDLRNKYGAPCPICSVKLPKAQPTIMLPKQKCRVCGFVDPRPRLTNKQWRDA